MALLFRITLTLIYSETDDPFVTGFTNKELSSAEGRDLSLLNFSFPLVFSPKNTKKQLILFQGHKALNICKKYLQQTFKYWIGILSGRPTQSVIFLKPHCS